jgi:penicillin G amidase
MGRSTNPLIQAISALTILARSKLLRTPQPKREGTVQLKGVDAPVEIIRDKWDVPHIYAQTLEDALFAQGFVHGQERLWQMDFNRRVVAGRLSEILGGISLPLDRWMRILGMRRIADKQASLLDNETQLLFNAYSAGVNAAIIEGPLPVEIKLLSYTPEPWSSVDAIAWSKMIAWTLCVNWESELLRAKLIANLGPEKAAELEPPWFDFWPRVTPPGVDYSCIGCEALQRASEARRFTGPASQQGVGSNNWVVSGSRTESGHPFLANDMHLGMTMPAIWYANHLVGG